MRSIGLVAVLLFWCVPAYAGSDENDVPLTLDIPLREEKPIKPLPETILPWTEACALPEGDAYSERDLVVLRARAWLTTGSVDTRVSYQIPPQDIKSLNANGATGAVFLGETEQRGANGLMLVYSAEVAPWRWLSGEVQYGQDSPKGSYGDHYWVDSPNAALLENLANKATWNYPNHQDDLVLGADTRSHRDWAAGNVYVRFLEVRRPWHEKVDLALGYERFRQDSSLANLSVTINHGMWYAPGLPLGPIAGFASSYCAAWSGPHFGIREEAEGPYGFSMDGTFLWSPFMVYRGEGYDNLGSNWAPTSNSSPNFLDKANGTAVHFQVGVRWDWRLLRLEAGYQRLYFYSSTGTRTFIGPDGSHSSLQLDFATAEMGGAYAGVTIHY
jgi:hypothetical protein